MRRSIRAVAHRKSSPPGYRGAPAAFIQRFIYSKNSGPPRAELLVYRAAKMKAPDHKIQMDLAGSGCL